MNAQDRAVCPRKFWIHTARSLPEIGDKLIQHRVVTSANHDYENVYEWLECELACSGGVELNVSRKHNDGNIDDTEPLSFLLIGNDVREMAGMIDSVAAQVEAVLQKPVTIGAIEHLGGDDFRYVPETA